MSFFHSDYPTDEDLLDYGHFRDALEKIVTKANTPLTVGVFGPWGSGKTSLMKMLYNKLDKDGRYLYRPVWFTAWKYDRQEVLWRTFILRVIDALYPREAEPADWPREERPILQNPTDDRQQQLIQLLDRLEASVYQAVDWEEIGPRAINWWQFVTNTSRAGVETAAMLGTAGLSGQLKKLLGNDETPVDEVRKAASAISKEVKSYHRRQLFHMEQFEKTFKEAVKLIGEEGENGRLIIFVDDLDRCLPEKAIEILEAIKLFLEVPNVVFVLGMDQAVIRKGIEARYGAAFSQTGGQERMELPIQGDSYLQKLVQIPFHLPALAMPDVKSFVSRLKTDLTPLSQEILAAGVYPNPRQIKRVLNIYQLLRSIADVRFKEDQIADPLLIKTIIIQTQYPDLYQLWRQYPTLVQTLEDEYARRPTTEAERLTGRPHLPKYDGDADEASTAVETIPARRGGLLDDYLEIKGTRYVLLERMMTFTIKTKGAERERFTFSGLKREEVQQYVRLAGAVESDEQAPVEVDGPLKDELLSNEPIRIQDGVRRLQSEQPDQIPVYQQAMVEVLSNPAQPTSQRLSAGEALAIMGDSRFHSEEGFYLPQEEMLGFVEIPAGNFRMGSDEHRDDEKPAHTLHLDRFWMARYPVTVAQFQCFVSQSGHEPANANSLQGSANHPVRYITWYEAMAYCEWLNKALRRWGQTPTVLKTMLTNKYQILLPTEVQWEKAARGTDGRLYPWGNEWEADKVNFKETNLNLPSPVGAFPSGASPYELLDMSGNVWEWAHTIYGKWENSNVTNLFKYPYVEDGREKQDRGDMWLRVLRGSSYYNASDRLRCAARNWNYPLNRGRDGGFRVCVSAISL